jgi:hypothetical protein
MDNSEIIQVLEQWFDTSTDSSNLKIVMHIIETTIRKPQNYCVELIADAITNSKLYVWLLPHLIPYGLRITPTIFKLYYEYDVYDWRHNPFNLSVKGIDNDTYIHHLEQLYTDEFKITVSVHDIFYDIPSDSNTIFRYNIIDETEIDSHLAGLKHALKLKQDQLITAKIKFALDRGVSPNILSNYHDTWISYAKQTHNTTLYEYLIAHGAIDEVSEYRKIHNSFKHIGLEYGLSITNENINLLTPVIYVAETNTHFLNGYHHVGRHYPHARLMALWIILFKLVRGFNLKMTLDFIRYNLWSGDNIHYYNLSFKDVPINPLFFKLLDAVDAKLYTHVEPVVYDVIGECVEHYLKTFNPIHCSIITRLLRWTSINESLFSKDYSYLSEYSYPGEPTMCSIIMMIALYNNMFPLGDNLVYSGINIIQLNVKVPDNFYETIESRYEDIISAIDYLDDEY